MENDVFLYNDVEQRVERVLMKLVEGGSNFKMRFTMVDIRVESAKLSVKDIQRSQMCTQHIQRPELQSAA